MKVDLLAELEDWQESLEALLTGFEAGERPAPEVLDRLWARCADRFERLREANYARGIEPLSEELRPRVEEALRMHAVVTSVISRSRDELLLELERVARARTMANELGTGTSSGRSVDLRA